MNKYDRIVGLATIFLIVGGLFLFSKQLEEKNSNSQSLILPDTQFKFRDMEKKYSLLQQVAEKTDEPPAQTRVVTRNF